MMTAEPEDLVLALSGNTLPCCDRKEEPSIFPVHMRTIPGVCQVDDDRL